MKKILLTGATGFLGSHLLRAFLNEGWEVLILKRSVSNTNRVSDIIHQVASIDIDIVSLESIFKQHGPFDSIVHTSTCYGRGGETVSHVIDANLGFPCDLLETATFFNTPIFFNASTILDVNLNAYALSKRQFEDWGKFFSSQGKICFVNLKLEHMYGPGDDSSKFTTYIFQSLKNNIPQVELTSGKQKRDFIYIDDVVSAYVILLKITKSENNFLEYEIGSGKAISIREFVELVKQVTHSRTNLVFGAKEYRNDEIMFSQADVNAMRQLGWEPTISLRDGILKSL